MNWQKRNRNKRGFNRAQCQKGGRVIRGGEFAEEARQRALLDAKGLVLRQGVEYTAKGAMPWCKRRSLDGRTDQVEYVRGGKVEVRTGETLLRNDLRWLRDPSRGGSKGRTEDPLAS